MAVMVVNAIGGKAIAEDITNYIKFTDKTGISSYAQGSVALAVKYGIITGKPGNKFDAKGNATRAEAAAILYRYFNFK